jgi:tetratricopeptide (TPR) repeat protein
MDIEQLYQQAQECTYNDSPTFDIRNAITLFSQVIEIDPFYKCALEERSRCYFRLGMHEERIKDILMYTKDNPDIRSKVDIADSLKQLGRFEIALDMLHGLDLDPQQMSTFGLRLRESLYRLTGKNELADLDKLKADTYDEEQRKLWDDPNYYGHYK